MTGDPPRDRPPPLLVVVSGPSGVGKDAVLSRVRERGISAGGFAVPVTMTTRTPREGEADGVDYIFVTPGEFARRVEADDLLEHAEVYGHRYGVPRSEVRRALDLGVDVIVRVDVQGAATLRRLMPEALFIFLVPGDRADLARRLEQRGTDPRTLRRRVEAAERELAERDRFDHVVVNVDGDLDGTADRVLEIVERERSRPGRRAVEV